MGALEVEALAVAIHPAHVIVVIWLSCHCGQQRQDRRQQSRIHVGDQSLSAVLSHSCLTLSSSEPFSCPDVLYPGGMCNLLVAGQFQTLS